MERICPFCTKEISWSATRCPHCTSHVPETTHSRFQVQSEIDQSRFQVQWKAALLLGFIVLITVALITDSSVLAVVTSIIVFVYNYPKNDTNS